MGPIAFALVESTEHPLLYFQMAVSPVTQFTRDQWKL